MRTLLFALIISLFTGCSSMGVMMRSMGKGLKSDSTQASHKMHCTSDTIGGYNCQ